MAYTTQRWSLPSEYDYSMATMGGLERTAAQGNPYATTEVKRRKGEQANVYQDLVTSFQKREEGAKAANVAREQEMRGIYGKQIAQYQEGGAFKAAGLAEIEQTKTRAIGAGTQQMISSGLYGTTTAASIPVQAENQAGLARLKLEDILQQRVTEAERGLAGMVERIEQPYPDYNMLLQASIAQGQR